MATVSTTASSNQIVNDDDRDDEYDYQLPFKVTDTEYVTTTLVHTRNISLADLFVTVFHRQELEPLEDNLLRSVNSLQQHINIIDPKAMLQQQNR